MGFAFKRDCLNEDANESFIKLGSIRNLAMNNSFIENAFSSIVKVLLTMTIILEI